MTDILTKNNESKQKEDLGKMYGGVFAVLQASNHGFSKAYIMVQNATIKVILKGHREHTDMGDEIELADKGLFDLNLEERTMEFFSRPTSQRMEAASIRLIKYLKGWGYKVETNSCIDPEHPRFKPNEVSLYL